MSSFRFTLLEIVKQGIYLFLKMQPRWDPAPKPLPNYCSIEICSRAFNHRVHRGHRENAGKLTLCALCVLCGGFQIENATYTHFFL